MSRGSRDGACSLERGDRERRVVIEAGEAPVFQTGRNSAKGNFEDKDFGSVPSSDCSR